MKFIFKKLFLSILVICFVFSFVQGKSANKNYESEKRQVANKPRNPKTGCCNVRYKNGKKTKEGLTKFKTLYPLNNCMSTKEAHRTKVNLSDEACKRHKTYISNLTKKKTKRL